MPSAAHGEGEVQASLHGGDRIVNRSVAGASIIDPGHGGQNTERAGQKVEAAPSVHAAAAE